MKTIKTAIIIGLLSAFTACQGQAGKKENAKIKTTKEMVLKDTVKQMNLLDEQTKVFGSIFGSMEENNSLGGATNYLELINKTEIPEEQKQEIKEIYKLYDMSLDPKKKVEFELKVNKKIKEAMNKAMREQ